jgi:uncharacterized membrane protein YdjX (TVP38/TMEM64 family)
MLPAEASAIANSMVYGPFWGFVLSWLSAMMGANMAFWLARSKGSCWIEKIIGTSRTDQLLQWTADHGAMALLVARIVPVIPFFALNYAAGLSGMRCATFNITTGVGIFPAIFALTVFCDQALRLHWSVWVGAAVLLATTVVTVKLTSAKWGHASTA